MFGTEKLAQLFQLEIILQEHVNKSETGNF
jgi:hypothetical protein